MWLRVPAFCGLLTGSHAKVLQATGSFLTRTMLRNRTSKGNHKRESLSLLKGFDLIKSDAFWLISHYINSQATLTGSFIIPHSGIYWDLYYFHTMAHTGTFITFTQWHILGALLLPHKGTYWELYYLHTTMPLPLQHFHGPEARVRTARSAQF